MVNIEKSNMDYDTDAAKSLNVSYSDIQNNISSMGCNEKFQEFEEKFNTLDTRYNNILEQGKVYDKMANETNNVKNSNLMSDNYKSDSASNILRNEFANIKECEDKVLSNIEEMIKINNENNLETENTDNSIWSMIDNFITNLIGGIVLSAKAEKWDLLNGELCSLNSDLLELLGFNRNEIIIESDGIKYTYNVNTHIFEYTNGKPFKYLVYVPMGLADLVNYPMTPSQRKELRNSIGGMTTLTAMAGQGEISIEYNSIDGKMSSLEGMNNAKDVIVVLPLKEAGGNYDKMKDSIVAFTKMMELVKGGELFCSGDNVLIGLSVGGRTAAELAITYPNIFNQSYVVDSSPNINVNDMNFSQLNQSKLKIRYINLTSYEKHENNWNAFEGKYQGDYAKIDGKNYVDVVRNGHNEETFRKILEKYLTGGFDSL